MTNPKDLQEAPASATAKVKSPKGFSYLFTLRDTAGFDLLAKLEAFEDMVLAKGWTPEENKSYGGSNFAAKPARPTKPCAEHVGQNLVQRMGKDGSPFWSHMIEGQFQADGKPKWCNGNKGTRTQFTVAEFEGDIGDSDYARGDF